MTRNLCNAVKHARRYALNQLNTLIVRVESAWRWLEWQRWKHAHLKCRDMNMFQSRVTKTQLKDFVEIYAMVYAQCLPNISSSRMRMSSNQSIKEATLGHTPDQASRWKQDVSKNLHALIDRTVSYVRARSARTLVISLKYHCITHVTVHSRIENILRITYYYHRTLRNT